MVVLGHRDVKVEVKNGVVGTQPVTMPPIKGLGSTLFYKMLENENEVNQIDGLTGEKVTCGQLLQKSVRTAIKIRSEGITRDDIISICTFNTINCCVPYIASLFLGIKTAPVDPSIKPNDIAFLLKQVNPKMIFVAHDSIQLIEEALQQAGIDAKIVDFEGTSKHLKFSDFLQPSTEEKTFVPVEVDPKETATILFSSGTTGMPKGICLSHYGLMGSYYQRDCYMTRGEVILGFGSMYSIVSTVRLLYSVLNAAVRLVYPKFNAEEVWDLVKKYKVKGMYLAPPQVIAMCKSGRPEDADTSSLKYMLLGGGTISKQQIEEIGKSLPEAIVALAYGQTELSGGGTMFRFPIVPEDMRLLNEHPESSGRPTPGSYCKIVDLDTGKLLGPNQRGELRVKCDFQMNGYYKMDSTSCWDSEGFLITGDIAYYDEDYRFYIVDRIKEMLKYQNWHVPPAKVEAALLTHDAIQAAVVLGLPHPEDGDHPMGIVVLKDAFVGKVSAEEIEKYVEEKVDERYRLRAGVKILKRIPVTPTGKINRRHVRDLVLQGAILV